MASNTNHHQTTMTPMKVTSHEQSSTQPSPDVPIFLRKTYHMIDTCDPEIASWTEDGETFVVKDPVRFERTIIPQFFKHSKFSSFVRQLNFYSFRKIKYADTIRIDPKLEAETANYWRFRHDKFRRGRPELLSEIKRMNGQKSTTPTTATAASSKAPVAAAVPSAAGIAPKKEEAPATAVQSEVQSLKKRIEEMSKNIDHLTAMVEKVSLKQERQENIVPDHATSAAGAPHKRKKMEDVEPASNEVDDDADLIRPDDMLSGMDLDEIEFPELLSPAIPSPTPMLKEASDNSAMTTTSSLAISDHEFVDQLFAVFNEESDDLLSSTDSSLLPFEPETLADTSNRPDPELMKRLGDALMLLPKDIQVLIVDRLIDAITRTDGFADFANRSEGEPKPSTTLPAVVEKPKVATASVPATTLLEDPKKDTPALPLAAATLAALLHHYSSQIQQQQPGTNTAKSMAKAPKSIPVIPVHA